MFFGIYYLPFDSIKMKTTLLIALIMSFSLQTKAQIQEPIPMVVNGDSIANFLLGDATITVKAKKSLEYERAKYYTLRVYDYAMIASAMLNEFQDSLAHITKRKDKNKYLKEVNKYLKDEFGDEIANMSIMNGKHLMKIIHKETGLTAYEIIGTYRGGLKATWWQGAVKLFGTTLKYEYDPLGEDKYIAAVIRDIESGELTPRKRVAKTEKAKQSISKKEKRKHKRKQKRVQRAARKKKN